MKRRDFLVAGAGLAIGGFAVGPLLRVFLRKNGLESYEIRRDCCFPVVRTDHAAGFRPFLSLQGISFDADPLRKIAETPNFAAVVFYDRSGEVLWREIFEFEGLTSHSIPLPDLRATGTLRVALATSAAAGIVPQSEVGAFLRQRTSMGMDGHHSIGCPADGELFQVRHLVPSPVGDESVVIGFYNPAVRALDGRIRLRDERGAVVFEKSVLWAPHSTVYLSIGSSPDGRFGEFHFVPEGGSRAFIAHGESPQGCVLHASWMMSPKAFAMSHGFAFGPGLDLNAPSPLRKAEEFLARGKLVDLRGRPEFRDWMTGDFAPSGRSSVLGGASWSSLVLVPNLTDRAVDVSMLRFDHDGNRFESAVAVTAPPFGIAVAEFKRPFEGMSPSLVCHPGQGSWPNTLSKIVSRSSDGLFLIQHFRPNELADSAALTEAKRRVMGGWISDYWISGFDEDVAKAILQLRNFSDVSSGRLVLQRVSTAGIEKEAPLSELAAGQARLIDLSEWVGGPGNYAVRVLSEKAPVKVAAFSRDPAGRPFALHGTQRVAWLKN